MKSIQPRKQRKEFYNAPLHKKRKRLASHLAENLLLKYDKRSLPVIKGDTIKVMRGSYKGHEDKIAQVHVRKGTIEVEGLTIVKADGKKIAHHMQPSNVLITKLNLTDKWRRKKLERGLTEEVKKEIEAEAKEQIKEVKEEKKMQEEKIEEPVEEELKKETEELSKPEKTVKETKEPAEKEQKTITTPKKKQPTEQKKTTTKKPSTTKKKTVKKTPAKTPKKKEEGK